MKVSARFGFLTKKALETCEEYGKEFAEKL
jgi:hypothetical protein